MYETSACGCAVPIVAHDTHTTRAASSEVLTLFCCPTPKLLKTRGAEHLLDS